MIKSRLSGSRVRCSQYPVRNNRYWPSHCKQDRYSSLLGPVASPAPHVVQNKNSNSLRWSVWQNFTRNTRSQRIIWNTSGPHLQKVLYVVTMRRIKFLKQYRAQRVVTSVACAYSSSTEPYIIRKRLAAEAFELPAPNSGHTIGYPSTGACS